MKSNISLVRFLYNNYKIKFDGKYGDDLYSYIIEKDNQLQHIHLTEKEHKEVELIKEELEQ